jgi:isopentenyl-diphosphate delta-isomerase
MKISDFIILVDRHDNVVGFEEKELVHRNNLLHRAFSIFLFNSKGEILLQKRAKSKYHSGGLWTNACCSHPRKDESVIIASKRRLKEELGMECDLKEIFSFYYNHNFNNVLFENEFDHVFTGVTDQVPHPDPEEVEDWKWMNPGLLYTEIYEKPELYTYWFRLSVKKVMNFHFSEN